MTKYNNETYRIDDIDENSDPTFEFQKKDGTKMSYIQYYKEVLFKCLKYYLILCYTLFFSILCIYYLY